MDQEGMAASFLQGKMGGEFNRRVRRRQGTESKRVADAIHAITAARSSKDVSDQESSTASPTLTKSIEDDSDSSESVIENDDCILYNNEVMYTTIKENAVCADVYIDDIDETETEDDEELFEEEVFEEVVFEEEAKPKSEVKKKLTMKPNTSSGRTRRDGSGINIDRRYRN